MLIVVMGVSGSGKSTVAGALASRLEIALLDADELHTPQARTQMSRGTPLTSAQRDEWMARVVARARDAESMVLACSALRRRHRSLLRGVDDTYLFELDVPPRELEERLENREDHFFDPHLLDDQLATFEQPAADEGIVVLDGTLPPGELVEQIVSVIGT